MMWCRDRGRSPAAETEDPALHEHVRRRSRDERGQDAEPDDLCEHVAIREPGGQTVAVDTPWATTLFRGKPILSGITAQVAL